MCTGVPVFIGRRMGGEEKSYGRRPRVSAISPEQIPANALTKFLNRKTQL